MKVIQYCSMTLVSVLSLLTGLQAQQMADVPSRGRMPMCGGPDSIFRMLCPLDISNETHYTVKVSLGAGQWWDINPVSFQDYTKEMSAISGIGAVNAEQTIAPLSVHTFTTQILGSTNPTITLRVTPISEDAPEPLSISVSFAFNQEGEQVNPPVSNSLFSATLTAIPSNIPQGSWTARTWRLSLKILPHGGVVPATEMDGQSTGDATEQ